MASPVSGFLQGVLVEVLWDIERCNVGGRREGERVVESVWWRAEVIEVRSHHGFTTAKIRYDAMGDFDEQVGEVRVFPYHIQINDETEKTQLRWRFYESSGDVTYNAGDVAQDVVSGVSGIRAEGDEEQSLRVFTLQQKHEELACQFERLQQLIHAQGYMFSRLSETEASTDRSCERLLGFLRQKLALVAQKPLQTYKNKNENTEASKLFDLSCTGSLRVQVDCSVEEFQILCRVLKGRSERSQILVDGRPFAPFSGSLQASVRVGQVLFDSLSSFCAALGISHDTDIMKIAKRERSSGKNNRSADAAIRVAGSYLVDHDADETPVALLICRGVHEGLEAEEQIDVLTRENQEMDPRTVWYSHPLRKQRMNVSYLLQYIYKFKSKCTYKECLTALNSDPVCFAIRWRPVPNPDPKVWTRRMIMPSDFAGTLEVEIPYIIIRGRQGIEEMKGMISDNYIKNQFK